MAENTWITSDTLVSRWTQATTKLHLDESIAAITRALIESQSPLTIILDLTKSETLLFDEYDLIDAVRQLPDANYVLVVASPEPEMEALAALLENTLGRPVQRYADVDSALLKLKAVSGGV